MKSIPISKPHKHRWHDRWYDWLCIDCGAVSCDKIKIRGYVK